MPDPLIVPWIWTMRGVPSATALTRAANELTSTVDPPAPPFVPLRPSRFSAAKPLTPCALPGVPPLELELELVLELEVELELVLLELVLELDVELLDVDELDEPPAGPYEQYRGVPTLMDGNSEAEQLIGPVSVA
jgi:hypothetical protein